MSDEDIYAKDPEHTTPEERAALVAQAREDRLKFEALDASGKVKVSHKATSKSKAKPKSVEDEDPLAVKVSKK